MRGGSSRPTSLRRSPASAAMPAQTGSEPPSGTAERTHCRSSASRQSGPAYYSAARDRDLGSEGDGKAGSPISDWRRRQRAVMEGIITAEAQVAEGNGGHFTRPWRVSSGCPADAPVHIRPRPPSARYTPIANSRQAGTRKPPPASSGTERPYLDRLRQDPKSVGIRTERRECARSPWLPWSLSVQSTADPDACRSGLNCSVAARQKLWTARSCTARHGFPQ